MPERDLNVTDEIFDWAKRVPYAPALIEGNRVIHYKTLCVAVMRAMAAFRDAGWAPDSLVAISMEGNVALQLVISLALARAGLTQVWLMPGDPLEYRVARAQALGVTAVISDLGPGLMRTIEHFVPDVSWLSAAETDVAYPDFRVGGTGRNVVIVQSSGTTGAPKDILVRHDDEMLLAKRADSVFAFRPGERHMTLVGFRFRAGMLRAWRCLSSGGAFVVPPQNWTTEDLLRCIDLHQVTFLSCTPMHIQILLQGIGGDVPRLPALRILRCGSAALPISVREAARRRISPNLYIYYGSNEAGAITVATPDLLDNYPDCVGLPQDGIEIEIVDENDKEVETGNLGQIRVRGTGISSQRMLRMPSEGTLAFKGDWYYPGDVGLCNEEGVLFLKGRSDDVMNFDGIMVGPSEIESVLGGHPAVVDAAAFPLPSALHQDIPAVAIILRQSVSIEELAGYCQQRMGIRAPRKFFTIDVIPRNPMGKILRRRLTELAVAQINAGTESTRG